MAPHSSTLAWKIPWMEEPGGLQSTGSLRVGCDGATSLSLFTFMHWRRKRQPTTVFLPGESQGWGSLVGCRLWGCTESDMTEATQKQQQQQHPSGGDDDGDDGFGDDDGGGNASDNDGGDSDDGSHHYSLLALLQVTAIAPDSKLLFKLGMTAPFYR